MTKLFNKSLAICGIVRDAEKGLKMNLPIIKELVMLFEDYNVILFENDSKDTTKEILKEWADIDPKHIHVFMENLGQKRPALLEDSVMCNPFFSRRRISKMVDLRNQYMLKMEQLNIGADYLMVVDLDVAQLFLEPILSSFRCNKNWDAVSAFGYSISPKLKRRYHDSYALTEYGDETTPQTEQKINALADKYGSLRETDDWIRVFSAFGGLAIYKFKAIEGLRYQVLDNEDDRVEVRCEHYSLYKQMAERGYDKVFINPSMKLKYQSVSFNVIKDHILRKLGVK